MSVSSNFLRQRALQAYRWVFAREWAVRFNYFVLDCALRGLGVLNFDNFNSSGETFLIEDLLPRYLPAKPVVFDVGANEGGYSALLLARFPGAAIHAFEPNPRAYERLRDRLGHGLTTVNAGLSQQPGELELFDHAGAAGSEHATFYREVIADLHQSQAQGVRVAVTTVDAYCARHQVTRIDFLKVDTEGHELEVARGATRMIAEGRIGVVQIEFNEMNRVSRVFLHDLLAAFPRHTFHRLLPHGLAEIRPQPVYGEIFAFQNLIGLPTP